MRFNGIGPPTFEEYRLEALDRQSALRERLRSAEGRLDQTRRERDFWQESWRVTIRELSSLNRSREVG